MRVGILVDGYNLYHSVKAAERHAGGRPMRWLDIRALCQTIINSAFGPTASLESIHYFSALAKHLERKKPDLVQRHRTYIAAIESTGVVVSLAVFKKKDHVNALGEFRIRLPYVSRAFRIATRAIRLTYRTHEEKATDVAIACKLLELLVTQACDAIVLVTGDSDIGPAVLTARRLFPGAQVGMAFPFDRHNRELARIASRSIKLSAQLYRAHQLPRSVVDATGKEIVKPVNW